MPKQLNPCELEIDLFCKGIQIDASCSLENDARLFARTRAGLGSGLEIIVPGQAGYKEIWMNAPVEEDFAQRSPYFLKKVGDKYKVHQTADDLWYEVGIPPEPKWYNRETSNGIRMSKIGVLQGTYLGVYVNNACMYWYMSPATNCQFCTSGLNVGVNEQATKEISDVVETALAAKEESGMTFLHFNSGYQYGKGLDHTARYVKALKEQVGCLVGIQVIPTMDFWKYDWLIDLGANHFSFCYEFHNPEYFKKYLPGKEQTVGQSTFFKAMEYTSKKMGKGRVSGEIIAGVEPIEDTLAAIDFITDLGAFPTICVFRPVIGSDLENLPSPDYDEMHIVYKYMYEACMKKNIPIGLAPNIEVSLVVQPGDAVYLADRGLRFAKYQTFLKLARFATKRYFARQLTPHAIAADANRPPVIQDELEVPAHMPR